ncbi:protein tyrosine kinase [Nocardia takedensis]
MMGLVDYLRIARRRWPALPAGLILGVAVAGFQIQSATTTYSATSTMYVSMATGTSVADSYQGGLAAQQRVRSYLELVASDTVVDRVIGQLALRMSREELRAEISADSPPATTLLRVTVTDAQPERARLLTDEVVSQFRALVDELETIERTAAPAARVAVVDRAERPTVASGPADTKTLALGLVAGLLLGAAAAAIWERLDRRVREASEVSGLLPPLGALTTGSESLLDDLRALRTRLPHKAKSVLVSAFERGSAPELAAGLAESVAATGGKVLVVDTETPTLTAASIVAPLPVAAPQSAVEGDWPVRNGMPDAAVAAQAAGSESLYENAAQRTTVLDLRKIPDHAPETPAAQANQSPGAHPKSAGAQANQSSVPQRPKSSGGLAAVLRGDAPLEDSVLADERGYALLPLGEADARTPDLLASVRFDALLTEAAARYDRVLVAASGTDALAVAAKCDTTVAVLPLPGPNADRVAQGWAALTAAGAKAAGFVTVSTPSRWSRAGRERR